MKKRLISLLAAVLFSFTAISAVALSLEQIDPSRIYTFDHECDESHVHGVGDLVIFPLKSTESADKYPEMKIDPSRIYTFDHECDESHVHGVGDMVIFPLDSDFELERSDHHVAGGAPYGQSYSCVAHHVTGSMCVVNVYNMYSCIVVGHNDIIHVYSHQGVFYLHG